MKGKMHQVNSFLPNCFQMMAQIPSCIISFHLHQCGEESPTPLVPSLPPFLLHGVCLPPRHPPCAKPCSRHKVSTPSSISTVRHTRTKKAGWGKTAASLASSQGETHWNICASTCRTSSGPHASCLPLAPPFPLSLFAPPPLHSCRPPRRPSFLCIRRHHTSSPPRQAPGWPWERCHPCVVTSAGHGSSRQRAPRIDLAPD